MTTTTKINWKASQDREAVLKTKDYLLRFVNELTFDSVTLPFRGKPGYQLVYLPTSHVQAEGVDVVAAVAQTFRVQQVLDHIKEHPEILSTDPAEAQLAAFLADADVSGQSAN